MHTHSKTLEDPAAVEALTHPIRQQILSALRDPSSAAAVARQIELPRQKVNYHLKELARVKLVARAGERRKGHLIEKLYQAVAGTFVISPRHAWNDGMREKALSEQLSLNRLIGLGEQLQQDANGLLDRAAFEGEEISTASVEAEVSFADETARSAFMHDYLATLGPLLKKYGSKKGTPFRAVLAVYPDPEDG